MHLSIEDTKISNKKLTLIDNNHFPFFCWDNFLPKVIYDELYNTWPSDEFYDSEIFGGKQGFQKKEVEKVSKFFETHSIWKQLINLFESQEFIDDAAKFVKPLQYKYRPLVASKKWILESSDIPFYKKPFTNKVEIDWELSRYNKKNFLDPHTDRLTKYLSLLLYFPDPEWKDEYGGGTVMYKPKNKKHDKNWSNNYIPLNYMNEINSFSYKPNRMCGFIKTGNSWHGVEPIKQPKGMWRKALAINIGIPESKYLSFTNRAVESYYRRTESKKFEQINVHK